MIEMLALALPEAGLQGFNAQEEPWSALPVAMWKSKYHLVLVQSVSSVLAQG
jgi:hypothetical protein